MPKNENRLNRINEELKKEIDEYFKSIDECDWYGKFED